MTIDEAIMVLELHNAWRKGADIEMQSPTKIGMAIDMVLCELKSLRKVLGANYSITVLVYNKKCGSKETEVSEVEKHLVKKKQV